MDNLRRPETSVSILALLSALGAAAYSYKQNMTIEGRLDDVDAHLKNSVSKVVELDKRVSQQRLEIDNFSSILHAKIKQQEETIRNLKVIIDVHQESLDRIELSIDGEVKPMRDRSINYQPVLTEGLRRENRERKEEVREVRNYRDSRAAREYRNEDEIEAEKDEQMLNQMLGKTEKKIGY